MQRLQDLRVAEDLGFVQAAGFTLEVNLAFAFHAKGSPVVDSKTRNNGLLARSTLQVLHWILSIRFFYLCFTHSLFFFCFHFEGNAWCGHNGFSHCPYPLKKHSLLPVCHTIMLLTTNQTSMMASCICCPQDSTQRFPHTISTDTVQRGFCVTVSAESTYTAKSAACSKAPPFGRHQSTPQWSSAQVVLLLSCTASYWHLQFAAAMLSTCVDVVVGGALCGLER